MTFLRKCLALQENLENPDYLANLGGAHQAAGDLAAAETCFEGAIKAEPDHADAHWNRGLARLLSGDLERGFTDYEWRWRLPEFRRRHTGIPAWDGEDLDGRTLLIHSEQGFGDTIQCIRYAALLSERGARVILETHAPLRRLVDDGYRDAVEESNSGWQPTWPANGLFVGLPGPLVQIDHVLTGPGLRAASARTLPVDGTDHRALLVEVLVEARRLSRS